MAETYLCHEEELHFSNASVKLLQNVWIEIGKGLQNMKGVEELLRVIKQNNSFGQGNRAMDIVDSHIYFQTVCPLIRWHEINEIILKELNDIGGQSRIFHNKPTIEVIEDRKRKIQILLNSIQIEINIKNKKAPNKN